MSQSKKPEIIPSALKIDKIIQKIESGEILIPAFQRTFVWKQNQIIELLESILNNYPIGSLLLWNTKDELNSSRNIAGYSIPDIDPDYPTNYVLDGQQRLSSIFGIFSINTKQDEDDKYIPNKDLFEIYFDLEKSHFLTKSEMDEDSKSTIYLRDLFEAGRLLDAYGLLDEMYRKAAQDLYSKFNNYEIPIVTIKHRTKDEVAVIFERINNTGTKLSTLDLMTAWTWTGDFHLIDAIDKLRTDISDKGFGGMGDNLILQIISGVLNDDTTTKGITSTKHEKIRDSWDGICESIKKGIDFLSTELRCTHLDFVPHNQQLIPIIKFFSAVAIPSSEQLTHLKKWFWITSFSNRYTNGQTTGKMNGDIETINQIIAKNKTATDLYEMNIHYVQFIQTKFSKGNPLSRATLLLMSQYEPLDLVKNIKIDLGRALSKYNRKEFHHIFPKAYLRTKNVNEDLINSLVNFCFLPSDSNKIISKRKPSDYFFNIIPQENKDEILSSNIIPNDDRIYSKDDFSKFILNRSKLLIKRVNEMIG